MAGGKYLNTEKNNKKKDIKEEVSTAEVVKEEASKEEIFVEDLIKEYSVNSETPKEEAQKEEISKEETPKEEISKKAAPKEKHRKEKRRRRPRIGGIIFYILYVLCIGAFVYGVNYGLGLLEDWLVKYEASQPHHTCQKVFDEIFADPDWKEIYDLAGVKDTTFEGKDVFAAYMEEQYGDIKLTYQETSAGLSGDKKYIILADDEKIAHFTLTGGTDSKTEIAEWKLGSVEVFFTRNQSVAVEKLPSYTVYINGVALDDSFTVYKVSTLAEDYIPQELNGYQLERQFISGLLMSPQVTVLDANGNPVETVYNSETNCYELTLPTMEITEAEQTLAVNAAQAYAKRMLNIVSKYALRAYYDVNSEIYNVICAVPVWWAQSFSHYEFRNQTISDFYRYSDSLYSVRVQFTLCVTRSDGSIKEWPMDNTFFCSRREDGSYIVTDMTNVDTQKRNEQVRLTFMNGDEILSSEFVPMDAAQLTLPAVTVPDGKVFSGWVKEEKDADGNITLNLVFSPSESGIISLSPGNRLESMTLHPLFENEGKAE